MEPRGNIEKPKDRKVKRQKNQKTEDMEIIEIKKDRILNMQSFHNANYTKYSLYYSCSSNSTFMLNSSN